MVDLSTLEQLLDDPRPRRARVDGRLVVPDGVVDGPGGRGVRVEHLGDPGWARARGFRLHVRRDLWIGVVDAEDLTDLEVRPLPGPGLVAPDAWTAWTAPTAPTGGVS